MCWARWKANRRWRREPAHQLFSHNGRPLKPVGNRPLCPTHRWWMNRTTLPGLGVGRVGSSRKGGTSDIFLLFAQLEEAPTHTAQTTRTNFYWTVLQTLVFVDLCQCKLQKRADKYVEKEAALFPSKAEHTSRRCRGFVLLSQVCHTTTQHIVSTHPSYCQT